MMMIIIKYSTLKTALFEHLMPPRITIAEHHSIEEVFGFNLSHWSTQSGEYSRHTSVDAIVVSGGGAKKEGREIWPSEATESRPFPAQQNKPRGRPITPLNRA